MRQILMCALLGLFLVACGGDPGDGKKEKPAKKAAAKKKVDGKKIYRQYCITCHGVNGDMGASGAFDLTTSKLTLDEKIAVITNGRNTMTPFKGLLSEAKIKAVAEFTETLQK